MSLQREIPTKKPTVNSRGVQAAHDIVIALELVQRIRRGRDDVLEVRHFRTGGKTICELEISTVDGRRQVGGVGYSSDPLFTSSMPIDAELQSVMPSQKLTPACQARFDSSTSL